MGILEAAKPALVICTRDRVRATEFYRDRLGLPLANEDSFAAIFNIGGATLRVSTVADFTPHEHTILGFSVQDEWQKTEKTGSRKPGQPELAPFR